MSNSTISLGDRMKRYELPTDMRLTRNVPAIIRIDGKAFHSWTKGMVRPWSPPFEICMAHAAYMLCREIEGVRLAYTQSDEITLLLVDYQSRTSQAWFDYRIQKIVAVSASIATGAFNQAAAICCPDQLQKKGPAFFDSRVYSIPTHEVCNAFLWRQQDATRNSIQMLGQASFSHKQLQRKNCSQIQDMLHEQKGINWNDIPTYRKRGTAFYRIRVSKEDTWRTRWVIDREMPILTQKREYVDNWVKPEPKVIQRKRLPKGVKAINPKFGFLFETEF